VKEANNANKSSTISIPDSVLLIHRQPECGVELINRPIQKVRLTRPGTPLIVGLKKPGVK